LTEHGLDPTSGDQASAGPPADDPAAPQQVASTPDDVHFGEVQTKRVESSGQRPDRNGHLATTKVSRIEPVGRGRPYGSRASGGSGVTKNTVPTDVYVDLDTMLDMQHHAAEDTSVELGGVLLGYRGTSDDGVPFVVINDSLRARHYKATRGSFKFTHETWADLNEQRASLPESTEFVGWYHTHPGWGVFLSDMDVFICDHFFSHQDDVALVIDPTSGDTGLFVRRGTPAGRAPGRLAHYHLYGHRRRIDSLDQWSDYFSGASPVSSPNAVFPGRSQPPIVVSAPHDGTSNRLMLLLGVGLIGSQMILGFLLFALLGRDPGESAATSPADIAVREMVVDDLLRKIAADGPQGMQQEFREIALANEELRASNLGLLSRVDSLGGQLQNSTEQVNKVMLELESTQTRLQQANGRLAKVALAGGAGEPTDSEGWRIHWWSLAGGLALGALMAGAGTYGLLRFTAAEDE
jgi:proteasome lid subunit RPN8/RPN11